jgi:DNA repair photolyase
MKPIYKPKGRALEYGDYCVNIYTGCNHGCTYCYARMMHNRYKPGVPFEDVRPREGILAALQAQLDTGAYAGKTVHLCFTCDPYPANIDTTITRAVIGAIKAAGANVQILTKGGSRARRDLDLLEESDWFGITISGNEAAEPDAASEADRLTTLYAAHKKGVKTWISFEPVYETHSVYAAIEKSAWVDVLRIGKLNYHNGPIDNWGAFGRECERLASVYGKNIYIKSDLRAEMEKGASLHA